MKMSLESQLTSWIKNDPIRYSALIIASELQLDDWCLAAGFVRNLAWDKIHGYQASTPLIDIDLIYFNPSKLSQAYEAELEMELQNKLPMNWSIKNQARMHLRNGDAPYKNTKDSMSYWPEIETAVGVRMIEHQKLEFLSPFGLESLYSLTITPNPKCSSLDSFNKRVSNKKWLEIWPNLSIKSSSP